MTKKHVEVKTYEYGDIKVMVRIDYDAKTISLIERDITRQSIDGFHHKPKQYVFVRRELEYMNGWRMVLKGIEYAIDEAEKELSEYIKAEEKAKHDLVTDVLMQATDIVKGRELKRKQKKS